MALLSGPVSADPGQGEGRSLLRDIDRTVTTVAGDADASAATQNPANLGWLSWWNASLDGSFTAPAARLRGSGVQGSLALPLPLNLGVVGLSAQWLWPGQPAPTAAEASLTAPAFETVDAPYTKLSAAFALPLWRWIPGLSMGLTVHQLVSSANDWAHGVTSLDLGVGWRPSRFVAVGLVARQLNMPVIEGGLDAGAAVDGAQRVPLTLDAEVAVRPLGTRGLEIAAGARVDTRQASSLRFRPDTLGGVQPRLRLQGRVGGVGLYAQSELYAARDGVLEGPRADLRVSAGLSVQLARGKVSGGALASGLLDSPVAAGGTLHVDVGAARSSAAVRTRGTGTVVRFDLSNYGGERGMFALVRALDALEGRAANVLLYVDRLGLSYPQIEEVREALARHRARGGWAAAYVDDVTVRSQFLVSATDRVYAHPERSLELLGLAVRRLYFGEVLQRLGVRSEFVRIAEYKGSAETYARSRASVPVATQRRQLLTDLHNHLVRLIGQDREVAPEEVASWWDQAPLGAERARELGILDALVYPDELEEALSAWAGAPAKVVKPARRRATGAWGEGPVVAVVHIDGELVSGKSLTIPVLGRRLVGGESVYDQLEALRKDRRVVAVVLRVNSPGGSVRAAELIARQLDRIAKDRPVVASFGTVAASGGYYVATSASAIVTDATTTTGSIGIFYPKLDLSGLLARVGIGVDTESTSAHAHLRSWLVPYDEDTRAAAQADIQRSYEIFTARVARARGMSAEEVDAVARGRVFSGVRALEVGLADRYGGLREAIHEAARLADVKPDRVTVRWVSSDPGPVGSIRRLFGLSLPNPLAIDGQGPGQPPGAALAGAVTGWRSILAALPAGLWWVPSPEPLALDEGAWIVE